MIFFPYITFYHYVRFQLHSIFHFHILIIIYQSDIFCMDIGMVTGEQFLNIAPLFLFPLFLALSYVPVPGIIIVPLTCMYAWLWTHKRGIIIIVLNLIWLLLLCVPHESSFFPTQILSEIWMVDLVCYLTNLLYFDILLL